MISSHWMNDGHGHLPYLGRAVQDSKAVRWHASAATHCETVRCVEQRRITERLVEFRAEAAEHEVVQENIACGFFANVFQLAWVRETESLSAILERIIDVCY